MKRAVQWVSAFLALWVCLSLCGCNWQETAEEFSSLVTPVTTTTTLPSVEVPMSLLSDGYRYTLLDEIQQANYNAVVRELYQARGQDTKVDDRCGVSIMLPNPLESEDCVKELFDAVYDDHPEFFYLTTEYGWVSIGEEYTSIRFYYIWNARERAARATEFEAAVSSLVTQAQGLTPVEQERLFHDALVMRCDYNEAATVGEGEVPDAAYYKAASPYAALCTGDPLCVGYSRAFQLLLSRVGIPNTSVFNDDHSWTMLWLDGEAYHTDVTWDDPTDGEEGYWYFNVTDEEIRATREYPEQNIPTATTTSYNYYVMNGWYIDDVYSDALGEAIREQITNGNEDIWLKFDVGEYADARQYLFDGQAFFDAVYAIEDDTLRDQWYGEVFYLETEELGIIQIYQED